MDIHLPKVPHSWRELAKEIAIIVVGVLIALSGEQAVESFHWRGLVAESKSNMNKDAYDVLSDSTERVVLEPCIDRYLGELSQRISSHRPVMRDPDARAPERPWSQSAWQAATAAGVVARMKTSDAQLYSVIFEGANAMDGWNRQEFDLWTELNILTVRPVPSEATSDRLLSDIERLRGLNHIIAMTGRQAIDNMKPLQLRLTRSDQEEIRRAGHSCAAVSPVP